MGKYYRIGSTKLREAEAAMRIRQKRYCEMCVVGELHGGIRRRFCSRRCMDWHVRVTTGQTTMEHARQVVRLPVGEILEMARKHKIVVVKDPKKVAQGRKGGLKLLAARGPEYFRAIVDQRKKSPRGGRPDVALAYRNDAPKPYRKNLRRDKIHELITSAA